MMPSDTQANPGAPTAATAARQSHPRGLYTLFWFAGLNAIEKRHLAVIVVLFIASAMFWSGFEQAGSSLNLFAERYTNRTFGGFETPAGWFQVFNPLFIITPAPAVALVWVALARRQRNPSLPVKFALGLVLWVPDSW